MVIESFRGGDPQPVYRRLAETGRQIPDGVDYLDSWVDLEHGRCFQLMEAADREQLDGWTELWSDLIEFEVVEVLSSEEAASAASPFTPLLPADRDSPR